MQQRGFLQRQVNMARYMLLGTVIITVINLALLVAQVDMYIVYSASVPYYLGWFGWFMDGGSLGQMTIAGMAMAAVVLAVYLLVWFLAGGKPIWLKVGLGMLVADTALLLALVLWMGGSIMEFFWEFALHGAVIYELVMGISAQKKLDAMPQAESVL
jgi:hypothetical protein